MTLDINRAWDNEFDSYPILLTHVDDIVTKTTDGLAVKYNLVLIADKEGGIDETGTYTGTVHLTML